MFLLKQTKTHKTNTRVVIQTYTAQYKPLFALGVERPLMSCCIQQRIACLYSFSSKGTYFVTVLVPIQ